ncbi:MAG: DUF423 domain-containing protein [Rhodospirillaceae bacterium]|nr:DUF423 domain-containing protein [Rhodospirillaceae bacterium]
MSTATFTTGIVGTILGLLAGGLGILGIVVGALAAHTGVPTASVAWVDTGLRYHLPHLAVLWVAVIAMPLVPLSVRRSLMSAACAWGLGILAFCGGLYVQAFSDLRPGVIVPAGAFALMAGWVFATHAAVRLVRGAA